MKHLNNKSIRFKKADFISMRTYISIGRRKIQMSQQNFPNESLHPTFTKNSRRKSIVTQQSLWNKNESQANMQTKNYFENDALR